MSSFDMISMAVRNLWKRKLRTFLTVLGVIIGTTSIVVMISIGIGMNEAFKEQLESIGSLNVIEVYKSWSSDSSSEELNEKALESMRQLEGVEFVTPVINEYFKLVSGRYVADVSIEGVLPEAMEGLGYKLETGRYLDEGDGVAIILGAYVPMDFYNPKLSDRYRWSGSEESVVDVENDKFQITYDYGYGTNYANKSVKPKKIEVLGVLSQGTNSSWYSIMSIEQVEKLIAEREKTENVTGSNKRKKGVYDNARVRVYNIEDVARIQQSINDMGYETYSLADNLDAMQETSRMLQLVLGAIGAIALLVAAIGITNTMVMSIYERTREIGVMKVIGASLADIKKLFLIEAALIGFLGGGAGIILSLGASVLINYIVAGYGQITSLSYIPLWLMLVSVAFATVIGVAAGYFPARRAMKLSALSAIKTE